MRALSSTPPKVGMRAMVAMASLAADALFVVFSPNAHAQPAVMRQPSLRPNSSPLCDSNIVSCLDLNDLAAHADAHLMVLPKTEGRGMAGVIL